MRDEFAELGQKMNRFFSGDAEPERRTCRSFDARTRHRLHKALDFMFDELERRHSKTRDIERTKVTRPATGTDVDIEGLSEQIKQEEQ